MLVNVHVCVYVCCVGGLAGSTASTNTEEGVDSFNYVVVSSHWSMYPVVS